jgi:hypothetical protein
MKVNLKHHQQNYSGTCDGLVYYATRHSNQLYARQYVRPRYTVANQTLGNSIRHLESLQPSQPFIKDLRQYIGLYNSRLWPDEKPLHNWHALYVRLMFAQAKALSIPVTCLTRELIESQMLPCHSVKTAVDAGLLAIVDGYERLENDL